MTYAKCLALSKRAINSNDEITTLQFPQASPAYGVHINSGNRNSTRLYLCLQNTRPKVSQGYFWGVSCPSSLDPPWRPCASSCLRLEPHSALLSDLCDPTGVRPLVPKQKWDIAVNAVSLETSNCRILHQLCPITFNTHFWNNHYVLEMVLKDT